MVYIYCMIWKKNRNKLTLLEIIWDWERERGREMSKEKKVEKKEQGK
jgi:hypothetical protein